MECPNIIWAAGNTSSPLLKTLQTPLDRFERVIVNSDLSVPGSQDVFVIGDAEACVNDSTENPLPEIAPGAMQEAKYVAKQIRFFQIKENHSNTSTTAPLFKHEIKNGIPF